MNESELIGDEIYSNGISKRRALIEAVLGALAIAAFVAFMIWFASL
jgi:hypothetical protein